MTLIANPNQSICSIQPICDSRQAIEDTCKEVEDPCQAVSVDDLILDDAIQLFPNPTTGVIPITTPENTECNATIRDAICRMIIPYHSTRQRRDRYLDRTPGLYFIELNDGQHSITKRIIKH